MASSAPREVDVSFWLWVATVVFGVLSTLLLLVNFEAMRTLALDVARQTNPSVEAAAAQDVMTLGLIIGLAIGFVFNVAQLVLALLMRKGRNWARVVLTVPTVLSVLLLLLSLPTSGFNRAAAIVQTLLVVAATLFMFLPAANPWFRKHSG